MKTLLFFTESFPYGTGETFIESEFPFLIQAFEKIIIVTSNTDEKQTRSIPENVEVVRIPYRSSLFFKLLSILGLLNSDFRQEISFIKNKLSLPLNYTVLYNLFFAYARGLELNNWLEKFVVKRKLDKNNLTIYSYWLDNFTIGQAMFKEANPSVKVFCRAHRWDVYYWWHKPPYLPLRSFILNKIDACFCIANDGLQYIKHLPFAHKTDNILLSRLGTFNKENQTAKYSNEKTVLVSCSNIIPMKRVHLIVEALSLIKSEKISWVHFGSGSLMHDVIKLAQERLSDCPNISFEFKGQVSNTDMLNFYRQYPVDLFINVSNSEGLPVSIMEACSFGVPVIATQVGGTDEIVRPGQNGFLLPESASAAEIAECINRFCQLDMLEKMRLRQGAQKIWSDEFNAEKNYRNFIAAINSL